MRAPKFLTALAVGLSLLLLVPLSARAAMILPGDIIRVSFTTDDGVLPSDADIVRVILAGSFITPISGMTGTLYDNNVLLGTDEDPVGLFGFVSAGSLFTFHSPAVVDLTSIMDGTTTGRIDIQIADGSFDLSFAGLSVGTATSSSGFTAIGGSFTSSYEIIPAPVPEPATLSLLGLGLAGVVVRRRMKRR